MFDKKAKPGPARQRQLDRYSRLVDRLSPKSKLGQGLLRAFITGGTICALGQVFLDMGLRYLDMTVTTATTFSSMMIVFITAVLTGVGVFDKIGKYAGAETLRPAWLYKNRRIIPMVHRRK